MTSTVESGSMAVPAAEQPAEPEPEQQEQGLGSAADTVPLRCGRVGAAPSDPGRRTRHRDGDHHDRRAARLGPGHNPSGHGSGAGCDAAPGEVGRPPAPPTGIRQHGPGGPARGPDGRPGRGVHGRADGRRRRDRGRPGRRTHGRGPQRPSRLGRPTGVRALRLRRDGPGSSHPRGHPGGRAHRCGPQSARPGRRDGARRPRPARHARPSPLPACRWTVTGRPVVRIPFDAHLATGGVLDLDRLSPATVAAARQLAALVTGSSSPDLPSPAPDPPPPRPSSSGLPGGLTVPALVIDAPARSGEQAGVESPAGSGPAGSPPARPVRTVAVALSARWSRSSPCWGGGRRSGRGTARRCRRGVRPGTVSRLMTGTPPGPPPVWLPRSGSRPPRRTARRC